MKKRLEQKRLHAFQLHRMHKKYKNHCDIPFVILCINIKMNTHLQFFSTSGFYEFATNRHTSKDNRQLVKLMYVTRILWRQHWLSQVRRQKTTQATSVRRLGSVWPVTCDWTLTNHTIEVCRVSNTVTSPFCTLKCSALLDQFSQRGQNIHYSIFILLNDMNWVVLLLYNSPRSRLCGMKDVQLSYEEDKIP